MYEVRFKKKDQIVIKISTPYKRAVDRIAQRKGTDMSNFIRQALAEYIETNHSSEFNRIYDECLQDFQSKPSEEGVRQ